MATNVDERSYIESNQPCFGWNLFDEGGAQGSEEKQLCQLPLDGANILQPTHNAFHINFTIKKCALRAGRRQGIISWMLPIIQLLAQEPTLLLTSGHAPPQEKGKDCIPIALFELEDS